MSSRTAQKTQAREARLALERRQAAEDRRRRRLALLAALAAVAVAVVVAVVVVAQGSKSERVAEAERVALFEGIPQDGEWLGDPGAPVVVEEYLDMQCPFCADFAVEQLPALLEERVRTGEVRMRLRMLSFLGEDSVEAGRFAAAAARQDRMWDVVEAFMARQGAENSGYVDEAFLRTVGGEGGVDVDRALQDAGGDAAAKLLSDADAAAAAAGIDATPTFRVGTENVAADGLEAAIERALKAAR